MLERYLFADESGCMNFARAPNVSKYFIICTVEFDALDHEMEMRMLRHDLLRRGLRLHDLFHATVDRQNVRNAVFEALGKMAFSIQATIIEKARADPSYWHDRPRFYRLPWYYHLKHAIAARVSETDRVTMTPASMGTRRERRAFESAVGSAFHECLPPENCLVDFRPSLADSGLQIADYCAWAMHRKWERGDTRSYDLVREKIVYEYEMWTHSAVRYY
ncbi:MAG: DUF3800 domain-containing protein [Minwuia sp.]|nr:DUF3800 domain-containing protein [Minwuia sp.]